MKLCYVQFSYQKISSWLTADVNNLIYGNHRLINASEMKGRICCLKAWQLLIYYFSCILSNAYDIDVRDSKRSSSTIGRDEEN